MRKVTVIVIQRLRMELLVTAKFENKEFSPIMIRDVGAAVLP
jgi:LEA14-like dessication related protein